MKLANDVFYLFANSIIQKNWQEAYKYLKEYLLINNNEDKNSLLYSLLLEDILKFENYDFSFISDLTFSKEKVVGYKAYYNLASDHILKRDYEGALKAMNYYCEAEKKNNKNNELSTIIIQILLEEVTSIEFKLKEKEQQIALKKKEENEQKNKALNFQYYFKKLQNDIENEAYEEAIKDCENVLKYTNEASQKYYNNILKLLKTIIIMSKNRCGLGKESMIYPDIKEYNFVLDLALKNGDYQTAYKNIGKCIYFNPQSSILKMYRFLLSEINNLNKKYVQKVTTSLNDEYILRLIKEKNYEKLKLILSKSLNSQKESFYLELLQLINFMEGMANKTVTYNDDIKYNYQSDDVVNTFYNSLKVGDYKLALKVVNLCVQTSKEDQTKFTIYKAILTDVVDTINKYQEQNAQIIKINEYNLKIDCLLDDIISNNFSLAYLLDLQLVLRGKQKITKLDELEQSLFNVVEISLSQNGNSLDFETYFNPIKRNDNSTSSLNKALKYGDYKTVLDIMNSTESLNQSDKLKNSKIYSVIRKILINLNAKSESKSNLNNRVEDNNLFNSNEYLELLKNLKRLIKKREYREAKKYIEENNFSDNQVLYETMVNYLINLESYVESCEEESLKR